MVFRHLSCPSSQSSRGVPAGEGCCGFGNSRRRFPGGRPRRRRVLRPGQACSTLALPASPQAKGAAVFFYLPMILVIGVPAGERCCGMTRNGLIGARDNDRGQTGGSSRSAPWTGVPRVVPQDLAAFGQLDGLATTAIALTTRRGVYNVGANPTPKHNSRSR